MSTAPASFDLSSSFSAALAAAAASAAANATVCRLSRAGDAAATVETVEAELADLHRRADECGTNYSKACFGAIGPEAAKEAHLKVKLMLRVYALEHDEAYVAAKFAVAHARLVALCDCGDRSRHGRRRRRRRRRRPRRRRGCEAGCEARKLRPLTPICGVFGPPCAALLGFSAALRQRKPWGKERRGTEHAADQRAREGLDITDFEKRRVHPACSACSCSSCSGSSTS